MAKKKVLRIKEKRQTNRDNTKRREKKTKKSLKGRSRKKAENWGRRAKMWITPLFTVIDNGSGEREREKK